MGSWSDQRKAAAGGILAMVLLLVGNLMTGHPPKLGADAASVTHFYAHHHRAILVGMILTGLAIPFYVWFVAHLALAIRGPWGASIALGGMLVAACAATGDALMAAGSEATKWGSDPNAIRVLYQLSTIAYSRLFWAGIAVAVPLAMAAAAGHLKPWVRWVAWAQVVLFLLGGISLKSGGFLSPTGGMALIAYLAYFIGTAAIAFAMWQGETATAPAAATSPA
jgi:hypothetical protein